MIRSSAVIPWKHRALVAVLLLLASTHCALSVFSSDISVINLPSYVQGLERVPYQSRVGMIPVIRFAESSSEIQVLAAKLEAKRLSGSFGVQREPVSPEKFICIVVGIVSMISMTWMTTAFGHRLNPTLGWLAGPFLLLIFYVSYAARSEANFWYPYDLPHYAIFAAACLAIFEGSWFLFLSLFVLDVPA